MTGDTAQNSLHISRILNDDSKWQFEMPALNDKNNGMMAFDLQASISLLLCTAVPHVHYQCYNSVDIHTPSSPWTSPFITCSPAFGPLCYCY
jgi:hypothetical protein